MVNGEPVMVDNEKKKDKEVEVKSQSVSTAAFLSMVIAESAKAIVGFIALYFFKPVWYWIVEHWKKRKEEDVEHDSEVSSEEQGKS